MAHFDDDEDVYRYLAEEFQELAADSARVARFQTAETIVQVELRKPAALITLRLRSGQDARADFGPTDLAPEVFFHTDADTLLQFCRGRLNLTVALARGQVKARGPVSKLLEILSLPGITA